MATMKLLVWFERRRRSKTLSLAQQLISLAMSTVIDLDSALKAFFEGRRAEMEDAIKQLFEREVKIGELRRTILEELTKQELPRNYREDLKELVRHLNHLADQVKDSARSLKVLGWPIFPKEIAEQYLKISGNLVEQVKALEECIESLGVSPLSVKEKAEQVSFSEEKIDQDYLQTKILFIKYRKELGPGILMGIRDLLDSMERSADVCVRTADYLRMLAASEVP